MQKIYLENIRLYAYHGCLKEETIIGSNYRVDLEVHADLKKSALSDQLDDTVDYVSLNAIVTQEMAIASKLLEHVAQRIINKIIAKESLVEQVKVKVAKLNPPIGGDVSSVSIELSQKRIRDKD